MCFVISRARYKGVQIADHNITVYKMLNTEIEGKLRPFSFTDTMIYELKKKNVEIPLQPNLKEYNNSIEVSKGYYSYKTITIAKKQVKYNSIKNKLFKCIIPKGSEYIYNPWDGVIISSNIIIQKHVPLFIVHSTNGGDTLIYNNEEAAKEDYNKRIRQYATNSNYKNILDEPNTKVFLRYPDGVTAISLEYI